MARTDTSKTVSVTHGSGVSVSVDVSDEDGAIVVQVDSNDETPSSLDGVPLIRIHLNDYCVANETPLKDGAIGW